MPVNADEMSLTTIVLWTRKERHQKQKGDVFVDGGAERGNDIPWEGKASVDREFEG